MSSFFQRVRQLAGAGAVPCRSRSSLRSFRACEQLGDRTRSSLGSSLGCDDADSDWRALREVPIHCNQRSSIPEFHHFAPTISRLLFRL